MTIGPINLTTAGVPLFTPVVWSGQPYMSAAMFSEVEIFRTGLGEHRLDLLMGQVIGNLGGDPTSIQVNVSDQGGYIQSYDCPTTYAASLDKTSNEPQAWIMNDIYLGEPRSRKVVSITHNFSNREKYRVGMTLEFDGRSFTTTSACQVWAGDGMIYSAGNF